MPSADDGILFIKVRDGSRHQLTAGLAAAHETLLSSGVNPADAAEAAMNALLSDAGFEPVLDPAHHRLLTLWDRACRAAALAAEGETELWPWPPPAGKCLLVDQARIRAALQAEGREPETSMSVSYGSDYDGPHYRLGITGNEDRTA
jgi:hypothetical protein